MTFARPETNKPILYLKPACIIFHISFFKSFLKGVAKKLHEKAINNALSCIPMDVKKLWKLSVLKGSSKMKLVLTTIFAMDFLSVQWGDRENFAEFRDCEFSISIVLTWIQVSTKLRALVWIARRNLIFCVHLYSPLTTVKIQTVFWKRGSICRLNYIAKLHLIFLQFIT